MLDLLTIEEDEQAAKQGWLLSHVFDQSTSRWLVEILPTRSNEKVKSARLMQTIVLNLARNKDPVALRAMSLVMASHAPAKPPKRKKK